jgi:osmotically-inducible protein OsmY
VVVAIEIGGLGPTRPRDDQIAAEVLRRLAWDAWVPKDALKVKIEQGRVTLCGRVDRDKQRTAALEDVSRLFGVARVYDQIAVKGRDKGGD